MSWIAGSSPTTTPESRGFRRPQRQDRVKRVGIARLAQPRHHLGLAQEPRDAGERLQVIGARAFRGEQQANQIDRLAVERLEIDPALEAGEQADQLLELRQLAVRNRNAVADPGAAELLALRQRLEDQPVALSGQLRGARGELLDRLLLAVHFERRNDRVRRDEIGERHCNRSGMKGYGCWWERGGL